MSICASGQGFTVLHLHVYQCIESEKQRSPNNNNKKLYTVLVTYFFFLFCPYNKTNKKIAIDFVLYPNAPFGFSMLLNSVYSVSSLMV